MQLLDLLHMPLRDWPISACAYDVDLVKQPRDKAKAVAAMLSSKMRQGREQQIRLNRCRDRRLRHLCKLGTCQHWVFVTEVDGQGSQDQDVGP